MFIYTQTV